MASRRKTQKKSTPQTTKRAPSACLAVARKGIHTSHDFADYMSGLMSDVVEGSVTPQVANAACNAGGKLLRVVELQHKYGAHPRRKDAVLQLSSNRV
jgi:hypothetical protein